MTRPFIAILAAVSALAVTAPDASALCNIAARPFVMGQPVTAPGALGPAAGLGALRTGEQSGLEPSPFGRAA